MKMGPEDQEKPQVQADNEQAGPDAGTGPPPEEPPKMEEIVTPEVLQAVVAGYKPDVKIVKFEARPGSKIGDNYMSIMYAVDIDLEDKEKNMETLQIMLKTIPRNAMRAEMINEMKAFQKEALVYLEIFPVLDRTQLEREISKRHLFTPWPKCYAAYVDGSTDYLAMENLKVAGYKMGNRKIGLDFNHASLVLKDLAKFHAISYAKFGGSREKILESYPVLHGGMFSEGNKVSEMQTQFFQQSFKHQSDLLRNMGEDTAANRMQKLSEFDFMGAIRKLLDAKCEHSIITHGDFWLNNMLFLYEEGDDDARRPIGTKFLDFQLTSASSRLLDIYYFIMTSTRADVLGEREGDLLMIYYSEFTSYAERLGINTKEQGLTWANFLKEGDDFRYYGVLMGLILAPMFGADADNIPDMETMKAEDFDNNEENMKKFLNDMANQSSTLKVKKLALDHLPRCKQVAHLF